MSNFTRSILYSTSVLVAGLVAIFAIYSNVATTPNGSSAAQISPAAGGSDLGIIYEETNVSGSLNDVSSDTHNMIGPVDDAMQKAIEQIDSTINEFETEENSAGEDKGSSYNDGQQSFKVSMDSGEVEDEMRDALDTEYLNDHVDAIVDEAAQKSIDEAGVNPDNYVGQRWITYRCWRGGDNDYWGTCRRRSTFEEDMEYNKAQIKSNTNSSVNSAINDAMGYADEMDPSSTTGQSAQDSAMSDAMNDAVNKADPSVQSEIEQKIEEEMRRRGL